MPDVTPITEDEELTALEKLLMHIAAIKSLKGLPNTWRALNLLELEHQALVAYNAEGEELPIEGGNLPLHAQFSEPEVVQAKGSEDIQGVLVSKGRSNGCNAIINQQVTAQQWMNDPEKWAKAYKASPRIIKLAGALMAGFAYMLPAFSRRGKPIIEPSLPYSEREIFISKWNYSRYSFDGAYATGGEFLDFRNVKLHPEHKNESMRESVDPNEKHKVLTHGNSPHKIMGVLADMYNTNRFKIDVYKRAKLLAYEMDHGKARVFGYTHPTEWGAAEGEAGLKAWYEKYETNRRPHFPPGREEFE